MEPPNKGQITFTKGHFSGPKMFTLLHEEQDKIAGQLFIIPPELLLKKIRSALEEISNSQLGVDDKQS